MCPGAQGTEIHIHTFPPHALKLKTGFVFCVFEMHSCQLVLEKNSSTLKFAHSLWHPACFVCKKCSRPVETADFLILEGKPVCHQCSPKCAKCGLNVTQNCVTALRKYFHASCFSCVGCQMVINNTSTLYQKNGHPCCSSCISRGSVFEHLKSHRSAMFLEEEEEEPDRRRVSEEGVGERTDESGHTRNLSAESDSATFSERTSRIESDQTSLGPSQVSSPSRPASQSPSNPRCLLG